MVTHMTDAHEDELVRRALDGLFEIANDDRPASVTASMREQIRELPAEECRRLVEQMVDTNRLAKLVEDPPPEGHGNMVGPAEGVEKVDQALEPLAELTLGENARRELDGMAAGERMHVLFSSLGGQTQTSQ